MPRTKSTKRKKGDHTSRNMLQAIQLNRQGLSVRKAAEKCNVKYATLFRYIKKNESISTALLQTQRLTPNYDVNKVFTDAQEEVLKMFVNDLALKFYGLTSTDVRRFAYQMAETDNIKCPDSWKKKQMAGKEWLRSFKSRHVDLSLTKPEECSLARATAFYNEFVQNSSSNLKNVTGSHPDFGNGCRVYNIDETATDTSDL